MAKLPVKHPDTIAGLAPDCRRVLRQQYDRIHVAVDPERVEPARQVSYVAQNGDIRFREETRSEVRARASVERARETATAIAEYRRVAAMWGVDVG